MGVAPTRRWRILRDDPAPGSLQLARDEVATTTVATGGPSTIRVYRWARPGTLSLGYAQDDAIVDRAYCRAEGIEVTRRRTGGGAIYHDHTGDLAYSIVAPREALPTDTIESYRLLLTPVIEALTDLGVPARLAEVDRPGPFPSACYLRPLEAAHDLIVETDRGVRKLGGSAQYRTKAAVLQHGSLTLRLPAERHAAVFADGPDPRTFREHVGEIAAFGIGMEKLASTLAASLADWADAQPGAFTDAEADAAERLATDLYAADSWVGDRRAPPSIDSP